MITKPTKYTAEWVLKETRDILSEIHANEEMVFIGEAFIHRGYSSTRFSEWRTQFKENDEISCTISHIDDIMKTRAMVGGLKNKLNPAIVKFHAINNLGMRDQQSVDHTSAGEKIEGINVTFAHANQHNNT